ncbi:MAG: RluA family pseudouridine synthase [Clostridia bacterium]|nr:RluA family pseudouridine synthase [Clostridia bacterium]
MEDRKFVVDGADQGKRIDVYLSDKNQDLSRSYIKNLINKNRVEVKGTNNVKPNYKIKQGDIITIAPEQLQEPKISAEKVPIDIVYEDDYLMVINKHQGMVVHPAPGNYSGTLVNSLLGYCKNLSSISGKIRPGIVHRLDKDTSGVLVVAKTDQVHIELAKQIKSRKALRKYTALVYGNIKEEKGTIDLPIARNPKNRKKMAIATEGGRCAVTHFKVEQRYGNYTLIEARLETGRTHQIRVHMSHIGHPVVGDPVYGPKKNEFNLTGQLLHAKLLGFYHPITGEYVEFTVELPEYFKEIILFLQQKVTKKQ